MYAVVTKLLSLFAFIFMLAACETVPQQIRDAQGLGLEVGDAIEPAGAQDLAEPEQYRYRLSIGDELEVRFFRRPEYNTQVSIAPDGTIALPFLPAIEAEGKTIEELSSELVRQYSRLSHESPRPVNKKYLISVGDLLEVRFPHVDKYSSTVKVRPDGKISLPLLNAVIAEGKTPEQLQDELQRYYQKKLKSAAVVVVSVLEASSNLVMANGHFARVTLPEMSNLYVSLRHAIELKVFVGGEVKRPGAVPYRPMLSSLQAIIETGGITEKSELQNVIILRKGVDGKPKYIVRNLAADIEGEKTEDDPEVVVTNDIALHPFDIVIVPKTGIATVSDGLNAYLFDLFPMLKNSSIGFNYQIGTMRVKQDTTVFTP